MGPVTTHRDESPFLRSIDSKQVIREFDGVLWDVSTVNPSLSAALLTMTAHHASPFTSSFGSTTNPCARQCLIDLDNFLSNLALLPVFNLGVFSLPCAGS
jgi:hypothetical protein